jgi:S1-C subfamily serine protease
MKATVSVLDTIIVFAGFVVLFFGTISIVALTSSAAATTSPSSNTTSLTRIFKQVGNSVVQIISPVSNSNSKITVNGNPVVGQSTTLGSGFIYDNQGRVVTSYDIVKGAKTVNVSFVDGNNFTAKVIGTDPSNDVAVLQIADNFSVEKVVPLTIANSSSLRVGQQVIAVGNPFGLSDTMTTGAVTETGRLLPNPDVRVNTPNVIQTDVAINPGESGSPLLNLQGQVVGMNIAIMSSTGESSGVAFAIPSNTISKVLPVLIHSGTYTHP